MGYQSCHIFRPKHYHTNSPVHHFLLVLQVYFSNRSAAYLKLGDAKSKALKDAERCMELAPKWSKSFSRLGAAQHALRRFDAAIQTLKVHDELSNRTIGRYYLVNLYNLFVSCFRLSCSLI